MTAGIFWVLLAALGNGSFGLLLKYNRHWNWEHLWLIYSLFAMVLFPWTVAFVTVPGLPHILALVPNADIGRVFLNGFCWGVGAVLYGLALKKVGLALTYGIAGGLATAAGSLLPLVILHPQELPTLRGRMIIGGVCLIVIGVALSSLAANLKATAIAKSANIDAVQEGASFVSGIAVAIGAGLLSSMLNLSFAYGAPLGRVAVTHGTDPLFAANLIWAVALPAGFLANAAYCAHLIRKNQSVHLFSSHRATFGLAVGMAVMWSGGYMCYGFAGSKLGELAAEVGWPLMSSLTILIANFWGAVSGEWARSGTKPRLVMAGAVLLLCAGMFIVGGAESVK
jgi:L-rhamnose-H+ transport protein